MTLCHDGKKCDTTTSNGHMRSAISNHICIYEMPPQLYFSLSIKDTHKQSLQRRMDEKWKVSKKEGSSSNKSVFARSCSTKSSSSTSKSPFTRSFSTSKSPLLRSCSQKGSTSPKSPSSSSISRKCSSLAKEQKARFYIMRRCVAMLVCWHKHGDNSWTLFNSLLYARWVIGFCSKTHTNFPTIRSRRDWSWCRPYFLFFFFHLL